MLLDFSLSSQESVTVCNGTCASDFVPLAFMALTRMTDFGSTTFVCNLTEAENFNKVVLDYMYNEPKVEDMPHSARSRAGLGESIDRQRCSLTLR